MSVIQADAMSRFLGEPMSEDTLFAFWKRAVVQGFANQMAQPVAPTRRGFTHAYRFTGDRNLEYREELAGSVKHRAHGVSGGVSTSRSRRTSYGRPVGLSMRLEWWIL